MNVKGAVEFILGRLATELPVDLYYHGVHHTLDVRKCALELAMAEGITDSGSLSLLEIAAAYHDSGFLIAYVGHELAGCQLARKHLPHFDVSAGDIEVICGMIMATHIPQSPKSHLEMIICDADLNYLGRDDFEPIAETLFMELKCRNMVHNRSVWNAMQIKFLSGHKYWTETALGTREKAAREHLAQIVLFEGRD